jgi:acyl-coenzyme A synthetase/AMP-(fatty) acid ligase
MQLLAAGQRRRAVARRHQELGLEVTPGDVFWNAADPGWVYGLYYALTRRWLPAGARCCSVPRSRRS